MSRDRFELAPPLVEEIFTHAQECHPEEACGIIGGPCHDVGTTLCRGRNLSSTPRVSFELDSETLVRQLDFEDVGLAMTAIYHSHPAGPGTPSPADVSRMSEGYPDSVILICSMADVREPVLRAFRMADGQVREIALVQGHEAVTLTSRPQDNTLLARELAHDLPS
jgi:proteasome lid subunit RPN8/RPN11